ncbi:SAM-dependent methyltransferase [Roseovarius arcticus]|uniref:SAM-dependent methyltransferase n=1 Tax=Roseovarius arcticus TaxID=2547404 RepID=UPI001FEA993B|nr:cyclopropane-fatty-acyl-phospholipid synthase family protein [Roseovarius arcticus]
MGMTSTYLLDLQLRKLIQRGSLTVYLPDETVKTYGKGNPHFTVYITEPALVRNLVVNPEFALGQGYMDGELLIEGDDLYGLMECVLGNLPENRATKWFDPARLVHHALRRIQQFNPVSRSRRNVHHHYDLSGELYSKFLDADRQYSCAYFRHPSNTLEQAQTQKKAHIAAKLLLEPRMRVLDIGCGWGGLALTLARDYGVSVLGITLSEEQHAYATERAKREGLSNLVTFRLADYREIRGQFDRIVSVGMFEHVGVPQYRAYFRTIRNLLTEDGVALVHSIGRAAPPGNTNPWIQKYIFPGGYAPSLSEAMTAVEREDLWPTDIETWRLHYAETLRHWRLRFLNRIDEVEALYDARFCRMWRYYLVATELSFRIGRQLVFQIQLARRRDAVPLTRDYLYVEATQNSDRMAAE